jgi:hypothetical protein
LRNIFAAPAAASAADERTASRRPKPYRGKLDGVAKAKAKPKGKAKAAAGK